MALRPLLLLLLLPLALVSRVHIVAAVKRPDAIYCTRTQIDAFDTARFARTPAKCSLQLRFGTCDDACLAGFNALLAIAPDCCDLTNAKLSEQTEDSIATCEKGRATNVYVPRTPTVALPNCTHTQKTAWDQRYGLATAFADCSRVTKTCSDACLREFENGVTNAPLCVDVSGYWSGEIKKRALQKCLDARGDDYRKNKVMMMMAEAGATAK